MQEMEQDGILIKRLGDKVVDGEKLMGIVSSMDNVQGVEKLKKKIRKEIHFLLKV
jgi:hypothetical protein